MSSKTTELKPCPFCGSGNIRYREAEHAVICARCKARGSIAPYEEMAIDMWNARAVEPKPDSWEKLEEDVMKNSCTYFGQLEKDCSECQYGQWQSGFNCWQSKNLDIVKRAKRLAKRESR